MKNNHRGKHILLVVNTMMSGLYAGFVTSSFLFQRFELSDTENRGVSCAVIISVLLAVLFGIMAYVSPQSPPEKSLKYYLARELMIFLLILIAIAVVGICSAVAMLPENKDMEFVRVLILIVAIAYLLYSYLVMLAAIIGVSVEVIRRGGNVAADSK